MSEKVIALLGCTIKEVHNYFSEERFYIEFIDNVTKDPAYKVDTQDFTKKTNKWLSELKILHQTLTAESHQPLSFGELYRIKKELQSNLELMHDFHRPLLMGVEELFKTEHLNICNKLLSEIDNKLTELQKKSQNVSEGIIIVSEEMHDYLANNRFNVEVIGNNANALVYKANHQDFTEKTNKWLSELKTLHQTLIAEQQHQPLSIEELQRAKKELQSALEFMHYFHNPGLIGVESGFREKQMKISNSIILSIDKSIQSLNVPLLNMGRGGNSPTNNENEPKPLTNNENKSKPAVKEKKAKIFSPYKGKQEKTQRYDIPEYTTKITGTPESQFSLYEHIPRFFISTQPWVDIPKSSELLALQALSKREHDSGQEQKPFSTLLKMIDGYHGLNKTELDTLLLRVKMLGLIHRYSQEILEESPKTERRDQLKTTSINVMGKFRKIKNDIIKKFNDSKNLEPNGLLYNAENFKKENTSWLGRIENLSLAILAGEYTPLTIGEEREIIADVNLLIESRAIKFPGGGTVLPLEFREFKINCKVACDELLHVVKQHRMISNELLSMEEPVVEQLDNIIINTYNKALYLGALYERSKSHEYMLDDEDVREVDGLELKRNLGNDVSIEDMDPCCRGYGWGKFRTLYEEWLKLDIKNPPPVSFYLWLEEKENEMFDRHMDTGHFSPVQGDRSKKLSKTSRLKIIKKDNQNIFVDLNFKPLNSLEKIEYVINAQDELWLNYNLNNEVIGRHHPNIIEDAKPVLCAGHITIENGKITYIDNGSGHYQPSARQLWQALCLLQHSGLISEKEGATLVWIINLVGDPNKMHQFSEIKNDLCENPRYKHPSSDSIFSESLPKNVRCSKR